MNLDPQNISTREKLILAGLYLSKYDAAGLKRLGFEGFVEAFNVVGYALGSRPASVKNYRDEFDPLFSNRRKGWHKRPRREYCLKVFEEYKDLDLATFTGLIKSFVGYDENVLSESGGKDAKGESGSFFAKRLITGLAAEQYFESVQPSFCLGHISVQSPPHPNPRLTKANLHEDLEMHASSKTVPILKTEETAKYANYAKPESFRGKGLDFSRVSRVSRFKEFLGRGFGSAEDFLREGRVLIVGHPILVRAALKLPTNRWGGGNPAAFCRKPLRR